MSSSPWPVYIAQCVLVMCRVFCFLLFFFVCVRVRVCVAMVWILNNMIGFEGLYIPFFFFIFVISPSSFGDVTGLPGMFRTCYHR